MERFVYMISDGTGITSESLADSLLSQFDTITFSKKTIPYVDTPEKANQVVAEINQCYDNTGHKPVAFITMVNPAISACFKAANALVLDLFNSFLTPLEHELGIKSSHLIGRTHGVLNTDTYNQRIEAINFTLAHDDGLKIQNYDKADIVLIGVSRCGKTPSCLYLALQFGILAANYPFTDEDLTDFTLPDILRSCKDKLFGLTIDAQRLCEIRMHRCPGSNYSSREQCIREVRDVEAMYRRENIPYLNSTHYSIEEIATRILASAGLKRKI